MLDIKNNFRNKYTNMVCRACCKDVETQTHIFEICPGIHKEEENNKVTQQDLFQNDPEKAREAASKESGMAAWNRRFLIIVILALVAIYPLAGVFNIETVIPVVTEGWSFLGLFEVGGSTTFETVKGLYKFDEIFQWATLIIEFYFGGQLAKAN